MNVKECQEELCKLEKLKKQILDSIEEAPQGTIRCEMAQGKYPQYYLMREEEKKLHPTGRYMRKDERELARLLIQKEYDKKVLKQLEAREIVLKQYITNTNTYHPEEIYKSLPLAKKKVVTPYIPTDEDYLAMWEKQYPSEQNGFPIVNGFTTERGELVRSKSEKMIADKLFYKGIPYRYEAALKLMQYGIVYPDFTLLNIHKRKTIYLEHFGMMDDPEYCKKAIEKLEAYEMNHICQGDKLLVTFESSMKSINMKQLDFLLEKHVLN